MRKGVPVLADGERHPSTRKDSRQRFGIKLVSICPRARVGGRFCASSWRCVSCPMVARLGAWRGSISRTGAKGAGVEGLPVFSV